MAKRWYIVHAYSNFERKVGDSIREKAAAAGLGHLIDDILVPTEKVVEMRRGRFDEALDNAGRLAAQDSNSENSMFAPRAFDCGC